MRFSFAASTPQRSHASKHRTILAAVLIASAVAQTGAAGPARDAAVIAVALPASGAEVARGAYLARLGDCAACHSVPGSPEFTGGLPLHSPLGTIYSTNITPDRDTGIGNYSLHDFDQALRSGNAPRHRLYPAMPYPSFAKTSNEDMRALYAYFMHGVTPVRRTPPKTELSFPFDQRWGLGVWNLAFLDAGAYRADPTHDTRWNRGAYLVQSLGHCGSCHTPRGVAYEERGYTQDSRKYLAGGISDHWFAPNLTGEPAIGLAAWSEADIVRFLKTGHGAGTMAFGPMKQVVADSLQHADAADLTSIAVYLKSLAPGGAPASFRPLAQPDRTEAWLASGDVHIPGGGLYSSACAKCHQPDGEGQAGKAPALARSAVVRAPDPSSVIHIILSGGAPHQAPGMAEIDPMPAFDKRLDDREIAEVASFVRRAWGNNAAPVTTRVVTQMRAALATESK